MNHFAIQQNSFAAREEMRSSITVVSISDKRDTLVCPKPRRLGLINTIANEQIRPLRWHMSYQSELCDSKAGSELLDIIMSKGVYAVEQACSQAASSPPFFCGSPPSRVSNPLNQDSHFGDAKVTPLSPRSIPTPVGMSSSPLSSARKVACARENFGNKPAVRIEGFDCLDRDRRNCSITAMA
ncbi:hypothetical protein ACET3Z_007324 [Daucus carota]